MNQKIARRLKIKAAIRTKVSGTAERPRLTVFRSNSQIYAQVIDDDEGVTLASISTLEKEFADLKATVEGAAKLGEAFGKRLQDKKITTVVFDRNGYLYHGVVKALADGTRKAGIIF